MRILLFMNEEMVRPMNVSSIESAEDAYLKQGGNSGNRAFFHAVYRYVKTEYNTVSFLEFDRNNQILNYSSDDINEMFDAMVIPSIIFEINYGSKKAIRNIIENIKSIKIPIVCLGVGTQAERFEDKKQLEDYSRDDIRDFVKCIEKSGGGLALRGYFTKEIFDDLGLQHTVVTGCPSFFQNGEKGICIFKTAHAEDEFVPVFNGSIRTLQTRAVRKFLSKYKESVYVDQGLFLDEFFGKKKYFFKGGGYSVS